MFNSAAGREEYIASALQGDFTFVFKIFRDVDLQVYRTPIATPADDKRDLLVLGVDYTVAINGDNGGTVTILNSGASESAEMLGGEPITLVRHLKVDRYVEYHQDGDLDPEVLNSDQDYQTYLIAQELEALSRSVVMPQSSHHAGVSNKFPSPAEGHYIRWSIKDPTTGEIRLENDIKVPKYIQDLATAVATVVTAEKAVEQKIVTLENHIAAVSHDLSLITGVSTGVAQDLQKIQDMSTQAHADILAAVAAKDAILLEQGATKQAAIEAKQAQTDALAVKANVDSALAQILTMKSAITAMRDQSDAAAIEAHHWANYPYGQLVPEGNMVDEYSAKHYQIEAHKAHVFADNQEIQDATSTVHSINPVGLKYGVNYWMEQLSTVISSGATSGDMYIRLRANGTLDPSMLPHSQDNFQSVFAPATGAEYPSGTFSSGMFWIIEGLTGDYTFVTGTLTGKKVANRDELFFDGSNFHLIGKPNFNVSDLIPKSSFATDAQAAAGTATDLVISPKTMHSASAGIMQSFLGQVASTSGGAGKMPMAKPDGTIDESYMPLGIGKTVTLPAAALTVGDMRKFNNYGIYCLPDKTENGKLVSDTMTLFGIANKFTESCIIPMRDKNVFHLYGIDTKTGAPQMALIVIPETTADTQVLTDATVKISILATSDARA